MKKKILITGANGFIGSFLVDEAIEKGYEVYAGIRACSNIQFLDKKKVRLLHLNLGAEDELHDQFSEVRSAEGDFDYVVHNAGIVHERKNESFDQTNYIGTKNLVNSLVCSGMKLEKFILVSSLASYGPGNPTDLLPIKNTDEKRPISFYGKSKQKAESFLASIPLLPYLIINPTAVYGPRDKAFLRYLKLIRFGLEVNVGTHLQMVSMIHVKDLATATIALASSTVSGRSFIVSDGNHYNKKQIGEYARTFLRKKTIKINLPLTPVKIAAGVVDRIQKRLTGTVPFLNRAKLEEISQSNWLCDSSEIWKTVGAAPKYDLEKGLQDSITWYRNNNWL